MESLRVFDFCSALIGAAIGVGMALLAVGEIPLQTRDFHACTDDVYLERSGGIRMWRFGFKGSYYLVFATGHYPERYVHYIGTFVPDVELKEEIHPGDCLTFTVSASSPKLTLGDDRLLGPQVALGVYLAGLKWLVQGWPFLGTPDVSLGTRWVRILKLERDGEVLISPYNALGWSLGVFATIALACLAVSFRDFRRFIRGRPSLLGTTLGQGHPSTKDPVTDGSQSDIRRRSGTDKS